MGKFIDLTGQKFGRWAVLGRGGKNKQGKILWECICDCGKYAMVEGNSLKSGNSTSCGCYGKTTQLKHGMHNTKIYKVWSAMKRRCYSPNDKAYKNYGAKGIQVCEEWSDSFENFYIWAINNGYKEGLSIDRVNSSGNYEPSNCRWTDRFVQNNNTSRNRPLEYNNKILNEDQWAREVGIDRKCLNSRIRRGWTIEKALTTPVKKLNRKK
jgi:hypothetical protein